MTMSRVPFFENLIQFQRAAFKAAYAEDDYSSYDPLDNPLRTDVCPGTYLKEDDDVLVYSGTQTVRVVCAATSRDSFVAWWMDAELGTPMVGTMQVQYVSDRAPADPNEEPMPNGSIYIPVP